MKTMIGKLPWIVLNIFLILYAVKITEQDYTSSTPYILLLSLTALALLASLNSKD